MDPSSGIDKSWRRNASLALVKFQFGSATELFDEQLKGQESGRIHAILKYLEEYGNASTAYNDIRQFAERLSKDEGTSILEKLGNQTVFEAVGSLTVEDKNQNVSLSP